MASANGCFYCYLTKSLLVSRLCSLYEHISQKCIVQINVINALAADAYSSFRSKIAWSSPKAGGNVSSSSTRSRIRLLKVHAAGFNKSLKCSLDWCELGASQPTYTAISYVWGSSEKCCEITINDRPFKTTKSAVSALTALCSSWKTKIFWIDAICIYTSRQPFLCHHFRWSMPPILVVFVATVPSILVRPFSLPQRI
jgi:hypothetical protein